MTTRITEGQRRARWELAALARVGIDVCDLLASRAEENSDAPRHYLATLDRWTRGEEAGAVLAARTRAVNAWGGSLTKDDMIDASHAPFALYLALSWLTDARNDLMKNPGHSWHTGRVGKSFARVVEALTGDPPDAALTMVRRWLDAHRAQVAGDAADARRRASLARAKTDKMAAEQALGTLPGVE